MESVNNRRTIRKYKSTPINDELLKKIINEACRASTTGNMQLYSIVVTKDEQMKEQLAPAHFNQPMVKNAPVVLTFCADFNRFTQWCEYRDADAGYDNFLSFMTAAIDALLAAQNFCTLAEEEGLGICYLGTALYNPDKIIEILRLPKLVVPVTTVTVGYPDENPKQVDRLPIEAVLHEETYKNYTKESIDRLYAYKESLEENKHFVSINNKETLAQVFTDLRYTRKDNEAISEKLWKVIKEQGF